MRLVNKDELGRVVVYEEGFWTGKKRIAIDGVELKRIDRKTFEYQEKDYIVKGSYLFGATLVNGTEKIVLARKLNAIEIILALLPFIVAAIGGAVGVVFGCLGAIFTVAFIRSSDNVFLKLLISIACTIIALICWLMVVFALLPLLLPLYA